MPRIEIVTYRQDWPQEFATASAEIRGLLGPVARRIDHIGSTSVPNLAAKDVIDVQVTVARIDRDEITELLAGSGFSLNPRIRTDHVPPGYPGPDADWTKAMLIAPDSHRRTNIHIRESGKPNQRYPILFRDYLRAHPDAAEAYSQIKHALARLHPDDADAYYDVKDPVCDLIIQAAERWAIETRWSQT